MIAVNLRAPIALTRMAAGRYVAVDVHRAGGIQLIAKRLAEGGFIQPDQITVTGRTLGIGRIVPCLQVEFLDGIHAGDGQIKVITSVVLRVASDADDPVVFDTNDPRPDDLAGLDVD